MLVCPKVVNPELFRPRSFARRFSVEKEDVCLHTLRIENPGRQTKQRVDIGFVQELPAHRFPRAALEENVVRHHNANTSMNLYQRFHMLQKIELFVASRCPK